MASPNTFAGGVQVVATVKAGQVVYWAVATSREDALSTVQQLLALGWTASLTYRRLTPDQVAALKLRPGGARGCLVRPYVPQRMSVIGGKAEVICSV
jgi:hypothetical protein